MLRKCVMFKCVIQLAVTGRTVDIIRETNYRELQSNILVKVKSNSYNISQRLTLAIFIQITCKIFA